MLKDYPFIYDARLIRLGEKCPNTEFFWSIFSLIWTEYGKIRTRKNSVFGLSSRSVIDVAIYSDV